ncbi:hypothetical protein DXG01_012827 [Tephrocybe rancida]|nr:hypothetical protein DXG01_012827 [Tephrocybe rancida]
MHEVHFANFRPKSKMGSTVIEAETTQTYQYTTYVPDNIMKPASSLPSKTPKCRILVVGRSGVGKSSLISTILGIDRQAFDIQHGRTGKADIYHEYTSPSKPQFVLHDSEGFEAGSFENWKPVKTFIEEKCDEKLPLKDRLHAIWLCIEAPRTGMRMIESADDKILNLASNFNITVIVVFTKYDRLFVEYFRKAGGEGSDLNTIRVNAENHLTRVIEGHQERFTYATMSTDKHFEMKGYLGIGRMLTNVIEVTQASLLEGEFSFIHSGG